MSKREIQTLACNIGNTQQIGDLLKEVDGQVNTGNYQYILAHADDGVIWGYVKDKSLNLSSQNFPNLSPVLRLETLWELRLFAKTSEWHAWRSDEQWFACTVTDGTGEPIKSFDEQYILWGTDPAENETPKGGFYPVQEADLGVVHMPPVEMKKDGRHTLTLSVRHYLGHDEAGAAYVKLSRLMDLGNGGVK